MGEVLKVLGQSAPSAATATTLYTVPASTRTVSSKVFACNQNSSSGVKVRVWVAVAGVADAAKQYIYYDYPLDVSTTLEITAGLAMAATDLLRVQSDTANVSFSAFGVEGVGLADAAQVLGQSAPSASTATSLYTVPAGKACVVSSVFACNQNVSAGPTAATSSSTVRVWVQINGAADTAAQYIFYDQKIANSETIALTPGLALSAGDVIRVQTSAANISFSAFGMEVAA